MNRTEHFLTCLAEECAEVSERVSKALRFGLAEVQPGQTMNNAERIAEELRDVVSVAAILSQEGLVSYPFPDPELAEQKRAKIERFMAISREQGVLSE